MRVTKKFIDSARRISASLLSHSAAAHEPDTNATGVTYYRQFLNNYPP